MNRNKLFVLSFATLLIGACSSEKAGHEVKYISDALTDSVRTELFLSEDNGLGMYYDICADDSFLYCADLKNDSILKVYPQITNPTIAGYATKGQGPEDVIFPFFTRETRQPGKRVKLVDIYGGSIKEVKSGLSKQPARIQFNSTKLPAIAMPEHFAETDSCIYATAVDDKGFMFYIYNKNNQKATNIEYWEDKEELVKKYSEEAVPFLLTGTICLNEERGLICRCMQFINCLYFYDLQGNLLKEVVIGKERKMPKEGKPENLGFPGNNQYSHYVTGTNSHLYILYSGEEDSYSSDKVLILDWDGNTQRMIQTDKEIARIAVTPDERYIYATVGTEEGGTDVVRFAL